MKGIKMVVLTSLLHVLMSYTESHGSEMVTSSRIAGATSVFFTENCGQVREDVLFYGSVGGVNVAISEDEIRYQLVRVIPMADGLPMDAQEAMRDPLHRYRGDPDSIETLEFTVRFLGANNSPRVIGEEKLGFYHNYYVGNDPDKWRNNVTNYRSVLIEDIYPGIDLRYYGHDGRLKYDLIVSPGADISDIQFHYEGIESLSTDESGGLCLATEWGTVRELKPVIILPEETMLAVEGCYRIVAENTLRFGLSEKHDPTSTLVIDPVIIYSTYCGWQGADMGRDITVDDEGNAYIIGEVYESGYNSFVACVTKLDRRGTLQWSTKFGGSGQDYSLAVAEPTGGKILTTGKTASADFPTVGNWGLSHGGGVFDAFVAELSIYSGSLRFSTCLGGNGNDMGYGISVARPNWVDGPGWVIPIAVTGETHSADFPCLAAGLPQHGGGGDVFVTICNDHYGVGYSECYGGSGDDWAVGISYDYNRESFELAGTTCSPDFPVMHGSGHVAGADAFYMRFIRELDDFLLLRSTCFGGSSDDYAWDITKRFDVDLPLVKPQAIVGSTCSADLDVDSTAAQDHNAGGSDIFLWEPASSAATYWGGSDDDYGLSIASNLMVLGTLDGFGVDLAWGIWVVGETNSSDFPEEGALQLGVGGVDVVLLNAGWGCSGGPDSLFRFYRRFSTRLGGSGDDYGGGVALDTSGKTAFVTGKTYSTDFPLLNAFRGVYLGEGDGFMTKISVGCCGQFTGGYTGNIDCSPDGRISLSDITALVDQVFISKQALCCSMAGNVNGSIDGKITLADIAALIDHVYISKAQTAPCW